VGPKLKKDQRALQEAGLGAGPYDLHNTLAVNLSRGCLHTASFGGHKIRTGQDNLRAKQGKI
jgi:hypothetical protein